MLIKLYTSLLAITASSLAAVAATQLPVGNDAVVDPCTIDYTSIRGKGSHEVSIKSNDGGKKNRTFLVNVPCSYKLGAPMGMIISYHGATKTAAEQEGLSQFSDENYMKGRDLIAVYPQGVGNTWQGASYHNSAISDINFTSDILTYMRTNYCIDNNRIYANGKSNGGGFVGTLACDVLGAQFAAFAPVSGAFYTDFDDKSPCAVGTGQRSVIPILEFHGLSDDKINYTGGAGAGGVTPPIPSWLQRWARRNGCAGNPPANLTLGTSYSVPHRDHVYNTTWNCSGNIDIVQGYSIQNLKHVWPSTHANDDSSRPSVIEATSIILDFFKRHNLTSTKPSPRSEL